MKEVQPSNRKTTRHWLPEAMLVTDCCPERLHQKTHMVKSIRRRDVRADCPRSSLQRQRNTKLDAHTRGQSTARECNSSSRQCWRSQFSRTRATVHQALHVACEPSESSCPRKVSRSLDIPEVQEDELYSSLGSRYYVFACLVPHAPLHLKICDTRTSPKLGELYKHTLHLTLRTICRMRWLKD